MRLVLRFALAIAAVLTLQGVASAQGGGDLFIVRGVPVDAQAASATIARDQAIVQGRTEAWTRLFRRIVPASAHGRQPMLTPEELDGLISSFEVANERRSSTRYKADITYRFNPGAVRSLLGRSGITFSEQVARPVLVLPVLNVAGRRDLWGADAGWWRQAWQNEAVRGGLVPLAVPQGSIDDVSTVSADTAVAADWATLGPIAERYGASAVAISEVRDEGGVLVVSVTRVDVRGAQGSEPIQVPVAGDLAQAAAQAAARANAIVQEDWKGQTSINFASGGTVRAEVRFSSAAEWAELQRDMAKVQNVRRLKVLGMAIGGALIEIRYAGREDQLVRAIEAQDLYLYREAPEMPALPGMMPAAAPAPSSDDPYILSRTPPVTAMPAPTAGPVPAGPVPSGTLPSGPVPSPGQ